MCFDDFNRRENRRFDTFADIRCSDYQGGICDTKKGIEDISEGIKQIHEGLYNIHGCQICRGINDCREGLFHIEEGLLEVTEGLCDIGLDGTCSAGKIQQGIAEICRGDTLILEGLHDVFLGQICRGERKIAAGLCEDERGLDHIIGGVKNY